MWASWTKTFAEKGLEKLLEKVFEFFVVFDSQMCAKQLQKLPLSE